MKNLKKNLGVAGLLCLAVLSACDKNAVQTIDGPAPSSRIKFFNFGVNAPNVNFYANDTKMTAITSTTGAESTIGTGYGSVGDGGFYSGIAAGTYTITGKISATTDNGLPIATIAAPIADGKYYSFYMSGFYNTTTKTSDSFIIEDPVPAIDFTVAYVRFVNAIANSSPMVLSVKNTSTGVVTAIGDAVAYKSGGAFISLPGGVYDISTRVPGATTDAITRAAVSFAAGSVYTIGARGDMTVVSTSAINRPFLDNTANR